MQLILNLRAQVPPEVVPNLHVHWKLPIVLVQSEVVVLQLCVPQFKGTPVHSLHKSELSMLDRITVYYQHV